MRKYGIHLLLVRQLRRLVLNAGKCKHGGDYESCKIILTGKVLHLEYMGSGKVRP